ncbi:MAG TPA: tetratricopeptide repeat protein [Rhizomicrobium sp.]|jgi:tetratricopeptide (TPR) repeat protein|nr:tetratricopeptide repeat protein [Rhizomicrobium sp.]
MDSKASVQAGSRLERLLGFLGKDSANASLLADAAQAAVDARDFDMAADLIARHDAIARPGPALINLQGLIALAQHRFADAAAIFGALRAQSDNPALRFNLAWSMAMTDAWRGALDLLDDETLAASPRAPSLKIQAMHHLDLYDDALACGEELARRYPDNRELMGALATLALDAEKPELAQRYAEQAGDNAEGRTALGMLSLGEQDTARSLALFDEAMQKQPNNPRAWLGRGLAQLAAGDTRAGVEAIDRGAELFQDHIGSWVASGWAHFVNCDYVRARASFDRALAIDQNFAESHGGVAVVDIVDGRLDEARKHCDIALRLDRSCFGGALAKSLLLAQAGHPQAAQKVRDIALNTPIGPSGKTIAQVLIGFGARK